MHLKLQKYLIEILPKMYLNKENENLYLAKKCFSQITQNEDMLTLYD